MRKRTTAPSIGAKLTLHKLKTRIVHWFLMAPLTVALLSSGEYRDQYCAFEVVVRSPKGDPVWPVSVSLLDRSMHAFTTALTGPAGIARLCDAPVGPISVRVGGQLCGATTVKDLKAFWMKTRRVYITYDNCSGEDFAFPGGCLVTIRVYSKTGQPISGVLFSGSNQRPAAREQTTISDAFGRIFRFVEYGGILNGELVKPGYLSQNIRVTCERGSLYEKEQRVVLEQ